MSEPDLRRIYQMRFAGIEEYRAAVWKVLINDFFRRWIPPGARLLDLGCGYGEFVNNVSAAERHAMDLNPATASQLGDEVTFHQQDCSAPWPFEPDSLDLVFTSNFFEHLPDKDTLSKTIARVRKHLKPGGRLLMLGPNIAVLKGRYWDFWDHHVALSDQSAAELLELHDFRVEANRPRFLPYNMSRVRRRPLFLVKLYLRLPFAWSLFGHQFFLAARKP